MIFLRPSHGYKSINEMYIFIDTPFCIVVEIGQTRSNNVSSYLMV